MLMVAVILATATPSVDLVVEARRALTAGRVEQAERMVGIAVDNGSKGEMLDRLRADIAFAAGRDGDALAGYEALLGHSPENPELALQAGLAALRVGNIEKASRFIPIAIAGSNSSWRAWNAAGVLADHGCDWAAADKAYLEATNRASNEPALLNNRGWSLLLRGQWQEAYPLLERASAAAPKDERIRDNLELARDALAAALPARLSGEDDGEWAARLNDAGVAAMLRGDRPRAIAAFARAILARDDWYQRAADNLKRVEANP